MNALGHRYYTLEPRPISYTSPKLSNHPATVKAKETADGLNDAYQEASNSHQMIRCKLMEFKKLIGQPDYADLSACFVGLKTLSAQMPVALTCSDSTNEPLELVGGPQEVQEAVKIFNEMLITCHQFLSETDVHLEKIKQRISSLKMLAVTQHILDVCSNFERQAPTNIDIFATEVRSLLLDIRTSAKQAKIG